MLASDVKRVGGANLILQLKFWNWAFAFRSDLGNPGDLLADAASSGSTPPHPPDPFAVNHAEGGSDSDEKQYTQREEDNPEEIRRAELDVYDNQERSRRKD